MMTNSTFTLKYITTVKPVFTPYYKNINQNLIIRTSQFFYFIFFLNILDNKQTVEYLFKKPSIMVFKRIKKMPNFLRAPYKHKKAQISLKNTVYCIIVKYLFYFNPNIEKKLFITLFLSLYSFLDSPLIYLISKNITVHQPTSYIIYE